MHLHKTDIHDLHIPSQGRDLHEGTKSPLFFFLSSRSISYSISILLSFRFLLVILSVYYWVPSNATFDASTLPCDHDYLHRKLNPVGFFVRTSTRSVCHCMYLPSHISLSFPHIASLASSNPYLPSPPTSIQPPHPTPPRHRQICTTSNPIPKAQDLYNPTSLPTHAKPRSPFPAQITLLTPFIAFP